jgi:hypothetical protein
MQNLAPGRPGVIRPQVGQALGSPVFAPPAGDASDVEAGGCETPAGAVGFGGADGVLCPGMPEEPGTGGLAVGNGGFGGAVDKPVAGTGGLGGGFEAAGTAFGGAGAGGFADGVGNGGRDSGS